MEFPREQNRALCEKYPFLIPTNRFSGMRITEAAGGGFWPGDPEAVPEYNYEYTELDAMPRGWRISFGEQLCEELKQALIKDGLLDKYRITQIKEKYGSLRWYANFDTDEISKIIDKYTRLSYRTCVKCGASATLITTGWISPYCDICCPTNERVLPVEDYLAGIGQEDPVEECPDD